MAPGSVIECVCAVPICSHAHMLPLPPPLSPLPPRVSSPSAVSSGSNVTVTFTQPPTGWPTGYFTGVVSAETSYGPGSACFDRNQALFNVSVVPQTSVKISPPAAATPLCPARSSNTASFKFGRTMVPATATLGSLLTLVDTAGLTCQVTDVAGMCVEV